MRFLMGAVVATALLAMAPGAAQADSVKIILDNPNLIHFYPNGQDSSMPSYYTSKNYFPQTLEQSIRQFTATSLQRDGIAAQVDDVVVTNGKALVTLSSSDSAALKQAAGYVKMLPAFMDSAHAGLGWTGAQKCKGATGCWDPSPGVSPWAFYLPLGLPLVNQKAVMLLNYPPSDALCSADYLSNFTMARWTQVLSRVGIVDPLLYETIVDVHPIAAPGSGQSTYIANTTQYFSSATPPNYDQALLDLLVYPAGRTGATTVPLQVAGSDALKVWATMIGSSSTPRPGTVGTLIRTGKPAIPWVATNHPDVTTYQRCPGDAKAAKSEAPAAPSTAATSTAAYTDDQLVQDEVLDLQAACVLQTLAASPGTSPEAALAQCKTIWCAENNGTCRVEDVCIQARLDYDFTSEGHCNCEEAAKAFCKANVNQACPSKTAVTSCKPFNDAAGCSKSTNSYATCKSLTVNTK